MALVAYFEHNMPMFHNRISS